MLAEVVVVTYNSRQKAEDELLGFIRLAERRAGVSWAFVDNSEDKADGAWISELVQQLPNVRVIQCPENVGFAEACNIAARTSSAEWMVLLNPDLTIGMSDLDSITSSLGALPAHVSSLAVSQDTGGFLHAGIGFNRFGWLLDLPVRREGGGVRERHFRLAAGRARLLGPSGGAGAYRREEFLHHGGFSAELFAWGEDAEFALLYALTGGRCELLDLRLAHQGGHSLTTRGGRQLRDRWLVRNRILIARRWYSWPQKVLFAVHLGLVALVKTPAMLSSGTLGAYLRGIVDGLRRKPVRPDLAIDHKLTVRRSRAFQRGEE